MSMSSPAGTVTPIGESIASSFCGSEGGLTPLATSPSGEGGFDGGFLSTTRGPAVIHDHIRCVSRVMTSCMSHHIYFTPRHSVTLALPIHQFTFVSPTFHKVVVPGKIHSYNMLYQAIVVFSKRFGLNNTLYMYFIGLV